MLWLACGTLGFYRNLTSGQKILSRVRMRSGIGAPRLSPVGHAASGVTPFFVDAARFAITQNCSTIFAKSELTFSELILILRLPLLATRSYVFSAKPETFRFHRDSEPSGAHHAYR